MQVTIASGHFIFLLSSWCTFPRHPLRNICLQCGNLLNCISQSGLGTSLLPSLLRTRWETPNNKKNHWYIWSQIYLALCLDSLFFSSTAYLRSQRHQITDESCTRQFSAPSPALEAVSYSWEVFPDRFVPDMYSGYPSLESEEAWARLWDFGAFSVPHESLAGLNKSSENGNFRMIDEAHGAGAGGLLEGAHQIHCLNLIRHLIYRHNWDYSHIPSFGGGEKTRWHHRDHCISTLRMVLICLTDVSPYVLQTDGSDTVIGTKSSPRKRRSYEKLVGWVKDHSVFDSVE